MSHYSPKISTRKYRYFYRDDNYKDFPFITSITVRLWDFVFRRNRGNLVNGNIKFRTIAFIKFFYDITFLLNQYVTFSLGMFLAHPLSMGRRKGQGSPLVPSTESIIYMTTFEVKVFLYTRDGSREVQMEK